MAASRKKAAKATKEPAPAGDGDLRQQTAALWKNRKAATPLSRLLAERLGQHTISVLALAGHLRVRPQRIYELARGVAPTADLALRLSRFFGDPDDFWFGLWSAEALAEAAHASARDLARIVPLAKRK